MTKILIVDDSLLARMAIKKCMADVSGLEFSEAVDGAAALQKYREAMPDIVFLDLTMPVMSGFEALEEIKKIDPKALVIVLSADAQKKTVDKVLEIGAFMMLRKPPKKEELIPALEKAMENLRPRK